MNVQSSELFDYTLETWEVKNTFLDVPKLPVCLSAFCFKYLGFGTQ